MPMYVYETIPAGPADAPQRFEVRQSMSDEPLSVHPDTGAPVRRVVCGGLVTFTNGAASAPAPAGCGASRCCMT
ncbi:MAG: zinc ribbon domain-containing protein [Gemmatimonadaceae bacterium]|nr:zinc ribbon domain-containing protein [Gemmatimonadaceae bacterium]